MTPGPWTPVLDWRGVGHTEVPSYTSPLAQAPDKEAHSTRSYGVGLRESALMDGSEPLCLIKGIRLSTATMGT